MTPLRRFEKEVVLVTGASRGIGRVIAMAFAREGAAVALVSSKAADVKRVAEEISATGGRAVPLAGDVSREADVQAFVAAAESALGPLDVLVNNAGISGPTGVATDISPSDFERVIAVNLTGPFLCSRAALKGMVARVRAGLPEGTRPGRIINIGSIAGKISYPQRSPYCSSKWGLIGLTRTLAEEFGGLGIRVNCICPGPVQTELLEGVARARAEAAGVPLEQVKQAYVAFTMMKKMVQPEEVAELALFLASDAGGSFTGQDIDISGGVASLSAFVAPMRAKP